jgi:hypothetical protein
VGISGGMVYPGGKDVWNRFAGPNMLDRPVGLGVQDHWRCMIGFVFVGDLTWSDSTLSSVNRYLRKVKRRESTHAKDSCLISLMVLFM